MTRDEVLAFGVPESQYKAFQEVYNRDLNKAAARKLAAEQQQTACEEEYHTRNAIASMLKLIKKPETLRSVLTFVNSAYFKEV